MARSGTGWRDPNIAGNVTWRDGQWGIGNFSKAYGESVCKCGEKFKKLAANHERCSKCATERTKAANRAAARRQWERMKEKKRMEAAKPVNKTAPIPCPSGCLDDQGRPMMVPHTARCCYRCEYKDERTLELDEICRELKTNAA